MLVFHLHTTGQTHNVKTDNYFVHIERRDWCSIEAVALAVVCVIFDSFLFVVNADHKIRILLTNLWLEMD
jgi:hypothetical protein